VGEEPRLRLIRGGYPETSVGSFTVVAAPEGSPPFEVDARAFEEDTYLVLSADPVARDPGEPLIKILTDAHEVEPESPGSVVVRAGRPLRMLAVVHDLGRDPTWKEEWVAGALERILRECESRELGSLALPPLGTRHGSLRVERFAALLGGALRGATAASLERVWLVADANRCRSLLEILRESQGG
jgi:hypothetical protein